MSDSAIIQKATLYEMADAIIDTTERTESFKVSDMPRLIREDVYNKGYADGYPDGYTDGHADGYAEGEANGSGGGESDLVLYGTYLLRDNPSITRPRDYISYSLEDSESYGFYIVASEITYGNIHSIQFGDEGFIYIHFDRNCHLAYEGYWQYYDGEDAVFVDVPDERFRIIDIKTPITVPKDIYDMFMGCVDNDQEKTSFDIGKKAQSDEFWDGALDPTLNWQNRFTGAVWNDKTFKPNQDIKPTGYANNLFYLTAITDLAGILEDCGVVLDTSGINVRGDFLFYYSNRMTRIPYLDLSNVTYQLGINSIFAYCSALHTVEGLRLRDDGNLTMSSSFDQCRELVNIKIYGTIGQNGLNLQWSDKLSRASIESIINALSTTTSGLSITLSKVAVNKAFETSAGKNDGYDSDDFRDLVQIHNNWTINLV